MRAIAHMRSRPLRLSSVGRSAMLAFPARVIIQLFLLVSILQHIQHIDGLSFRMTRSARSNAIWLRILRSLRRVVLVAGLAMAEIGSAAAADNVNCTSAQFSTAEADLSAALIAGVECMRAKGRPDIGQKVLERYRSRERVGLTI